MIKEPAKGDVALRYDEGKAPLHYLLDFPCALEAFCRVLEQGAIKYEDLNWKKGGKPDEEYLAACFRHLMKFRKGQHYDDELGVSHIAQAIWNLMVLFECNYSERIKSDDFFEKQTELYRRYKPAAIPAEENDSGQRDSEACEETVTDFNPSRDI